MGGEMIKLPPRFKIFHNVSEDYYFIKERFYFFFYRSEQRVRERDSFIGKKVGFCESIRLLPIFKQRYDTLKEAEAKVKLILEYENQHLTPKTPDEIKLVKEL
jgi:hypothetical protein